jgi:hypothetical protein
MKKRTYRIPEIAKRAEKALRIAVSNVMREHRIKGLPIFVWQENRVVRISPRRIHL